MIFILNHDVLEILQPSKHALDLPAASITPEFSTVFCTVLFAILFVRRNHLDISGFLKILIQTIAVLGLIPDQSFGGLRCHR